jgi:hypothetical protein
MSLNINAEQNKSNDIICNIFKLNHRKLYMTNLLVFWLEKEFVWLAFTFEQRNKLLEHIPPMLRARAAASGEGAAVARLDGAPILAFGVCGRQST